ncbi:hypothetical protein [Nannocystis sp. SCPEA4]|uniref:c-type cytochrome n=1 Tax=Nannocystis sp. SCPEA4 TaxID=2996787 RepID=UPI00227200CD|nr:hypothetical protein [Nannocystis sp. SCPEA4]MCY1059387.1 hypothetical protein [Nannocystis sp. SCPEA4]
MSPVERALRRGRRNRRLALSFVLLVGGVLLATRFLLAVPDDHSDVVEDFKYGSIGADVDTGVPYWIWRVMPALCSAQLDARGDGSSRWYEAFGFITEPGRDRPIGFSKRRRLGIELVGLNCAVCHTATVRRAPEDPPQLVLGMPANQLDLLAYFEFLFDCADDPAFTTANVLAHVDAVTDLGPVERQIYKIAVPRVREGLLARGGRLEPLRAERFRSGKGRVDTFNPYKALVLNFPETELAVPGAVDFPSIWNQRVRADMQLHWDGNNRSLFERNISAAIGAGVTPHSIDMPRIERIAAWLQDFPPPRHPSLADGASAGVAEGRQLYARHCEACHGSPEHNWQGERVGTVEPLADIGTDPGRLLSYTVDFVANQWMIGADRPWRFHHFRRTDGYANMPLDGLWARAPYLHNGSVPSLRDLLARPPAGSESDLRARAEEQRRAGDAAIEAGVREARARGERPLLFFRGDDVLDPANVGFVVDRAGEGARRHALYDTTTEGRHNGGHLYGTSLSDVEKEQLLAYLKTL